jgi:hypothetical protein
MTAAATAVPPSLPSTRPVRREPRLFEAAGETLEDAILRTWDELVVEGRVGCPVCAGEMAAAAGCPRCGSELL